MASTERKSPSFMKSWRRRIATGITGRKEVLRGMIVDTPEAHIHIDALAHAGQGVFYTDKGDLICVAKIEGISQEGMSQKNLDENCLSLGRILSKLGNAGTPMTIHAWSDTAMVKAPELPTDYYNEFLAEVEEERNKFLGARVVWKTETYIAFEWRGEFSMGGAVTIPEAVKAYIGHLKARLAHKNNEADRLLYTATAVFSKAKQIRRIFPERCAGEMIRFLESVDQVLSGITNETNGIGVFEEYDSSVQQANAPGRVMIQAKRLNYQDAYKAIYALGDPDPFRRSLAHLPNEVDDCFEIARKLGAEDVNFDYLLAVATSEQFGQVVHDELREIAEHGPYTVGGIPRQVVAIRALPYKVPHDLYRMLREAGIPYTVRARWSPLSDMGCSDYLRRAVNRKSNSRREMDHVTSEVLQQRVEEGIAKGLGGFGLGSILIALNGTPYRDKDGVLLSGTKVLLEGLRIVKQWASVNSIDIATLHRPYDQGNAHYALYPGAWELDPLELIPLRNVALGRVLPIYSTCPRMPVIEAYPKIPILTLENAAHEIITRGLEVGEVGLGAICGSSGFGKSYLANDIIQNALKYEGLKSQGRGPSSLTIDTIEFGKGTDEGSSFNAKMRLLGGKVIQFGENGISDCLNPWDVEIPNLADGSPRGYGAELLELLTGLMVTMAGGDIQSGGPVTKEQERAFTKAIVRVGLTPASDIPGKVRSLRAVRDEIDDKYARTLIEPWVSVNEYGRFFPAEADSSKSMAVNYNFPLTMGNQVRAVLFGLVMARIGQRVYGPHLAKLLLVDEVGAGLAPSDEKRDEAVLQMARSMLGKLFANARRFGARSFILFQFPKQILAMGPTLKGVIQNQSTTYFLGNLSDAEGAEELFRIPEPIFKSLRTLEQHQFAMIQEGLMTKVRIVNPPLAHCASTTNKGEVTLRDAMIASGKFHHVVQTPKGRANVVDTLAVVRAMAICLQDSYDAKTHKDLQDYIDEYRALADTRVSNSRALVALSAGRTR